MPKPHKKLDSETEQRMIEENIQMGRGDLHTKKIGQIKKERSHLRELGFFVPQMPVGPIDPATQPEPLNTLLNNMRISGGK